VPFSSPVQKRKAEDDLPRVHDKLVKRDAPAVSHTKPGAPIQKTTHVTSTSTKAEPKPLASASRGVAPPNRVTSTPASVTQPLKPPKKGSYAEIIARAKANQAKIGPVGRIQHKPIEKGPSKRERQEIKDQESLSLSNTKNVSRTGTKGNLRDGRNGTRQNDRKSSKKAEPLLEKKPKKAALATTGYTGTARPVALSSKSSSRSGSALRASGKDQYGHFQNRYDSEDDEDDEDQEEEEQDDYDSDGSSDMEAAAFEVDEEEERAARIARKEDAEALREEARLKREKEEKRRKLTAMAKTRR
jgi:protein SPT2